MLFEKLRRTTNSKNFIPEIDGLRFFAIITVILYHLNTAYSSEIGTGLKEISGYREFFSFSWWVVRMDLGVKVFFSISGFILALPFINQKLNNAPKVNVKDYFYRRLTRLEPPFVISLIIFFFIHKIYFNTALSELLPHLISGILYAHCFVFGTPSSINPVTWSLETEAQFYILVPLIFGLLLSKPKLKYLFFLGTLLMILGIAMKSYIWNQQLLHFQYSIFYYLVNFITGFLFAFLFAKKRDWMTKKDIIYDFMGIISVITIFVFYKPQALWYNNLILNIGVFAMFLSAFKGKLTNYFYTLPLIYTIGGMCYSIYLLHYALLHLTVKFTTAASTGFGYISDYWLQAAINVPIILLVSSIFFVLIEKPCMDKSWPSKLKNRLFK